MKDFTKKQLIRFRVALIFESKKRTNYIIKKNLFHHVGDNFFFQPRIIPSDPELISFHNNVHVASGVTFINHDIVHNMLNNLEIGNFNYQTGCIEIMDNVFIGSNSTILPDIKIGPNAIVAAGSVVTHDVKPNTVVAGVPAKVIGTFQDYIEKRKNFEYLNVENAWEKFEREHNNEEI